MDKLLKDLNIDETYTKPIKRIKIFNHVKDNIYNKTGYNYQADLLELPKTKEGYKYLLVVVDLYSDNFDIEPLLNKEAKTTENAIKLIFKRKFIKIPKMSLTTDGGNEFKKEFNNYLNKNDIHHKTAAPYRHKQMGNVESLNKQLARLLVGYMNTKEKETGRQYNEWTDILNIIRERYNKIRRDKFNNMEFREPIFDLSKEPKYKVGDMVYYKLDYPKSALNNKQSTANFRVGDYRWSHEPHQITQILIYPFSPTFRYLINGINNVSYSEDELMPSKEASPKYAVKSIIGKKRTKGKIYYLVWWLGYKKDESTWERKEELINDGLTNIINEFEDKI